MDAAVRFPLPARRTLIGEALTIVFQLRVTLKSSREGLPVIRKSIRFLPSGEITVTWSVEPFADAVDVKLQPISNSMKTEAKQVWVRNV